MAILKHIASKNPNYGAALEYLIFKYDELRTEIVSCEMSFIWTV